MSIEQGICLRKTGLVGLNNLLGNSGKITLGEIVVFAAQSHSFKTGMLLKVPLWIAKYGPTSTELSNRVPMIMFTSLENSTVDIFKWLYMRILVDISTSQLSPLTDPLDIEKFVIDYFHKAGCSLYVRAYPPASFTFADMVRDIEHLEEDGFKVVASIIDNVHLMRKECDYRFSSNANTDLLKLYTKVVSYHKSSDTTLFTSYPLLRLPTDERTGIESSIQFNAIHSEVPNAFSREIDKIVYLDVECGTTELRLRFGKSRYSLDIPEEDLSCSYKFDASGIKDDVDQVN